MYDRLNLHGPPYNFDGMGVYRKAIDKLNVASKYPRLFGPVGSSFNPLDMYAKDYPKHYKLSDEDAVKYLLRRNRTPGHGLDTEAQVRQRIAEVRHAANMTGVDFGLLMAIAAAESGVGVDGMGYKHKNVLNYKNHTGDSSYTFKTFQEGLIKGAELLRDAYGITNPAGVERFIRTSGRRIDGKGYYAAERHNKHIPDLGYGKRIGAVYKSITGTDYFADDLMKADRFKRYYNNDDFAYMEKQGLNWKPTIKTR